MDTRWLALAVISLVLQGRVVFAQGPEVAVRIERVGAGAVVSNPVAIPVEGGFTYSGTVSAWGFQSAFQFSSVISPGTHREAFGGFFFLRNESLLPQYFKADFGITNLPSPLPAVASGSIGGVLFGGPAGGAFTSVQDVPVFRAIVNRSTKSVTIASLLNGSPYAVSTAPNQSMPVPREGFGEPFQPPIPIGLLGDSREIRLQFLLCGGCEVSFNTSFIVSLVGGDPPPPLDSDADGFSDLQDNCPTVYNPTQADCDNDGIGDACEPGEDYNANGIPDYCECIADLFVDGVVNGVDLGVLLAYWGPTTSSSASQRSDLNRDGAVDGIDLGYLLSRWGPCTN